MGGCAPQTPRGEGKRIASVEVTNTITVVRTAAALIVTSVHLTPRDEINARYDVHPPIGFIDPSVVSPFLERCIYVAPENR
jgi:hypothetical protein